MTYERQEPTLKLGRVTVKWFYWLRRRHPMLPPRFVYWHRDAYGTVVLWFGNVSLVWA